MVFDDDISELEDAVCYSDHAMKEAMLHKLSDTLLWDETHRCYVRLYDCSLEERTGWIDFWVEVIWPQDHRMYPGKLRLRAHQFKPVHPLLALTIGASIDASE